MTSTSRSPRRRKRPQTGSRASVSRAQADQRFARIDFKGDPAPDYSAYAEWYCTAVVQGAVTACRWERLGCQRFLHMLQEARKPRCEFIYDPDRVADVCAFGETLPHSKGFEGLIVLEPVQCWWLAAIFGFRERDTGRRWTREVAFWVPRKNGKTELAKIVVLYCQNFEGEPGAEGVIIAGSERQADIPFKAIRHVVDTVGDLREWLLAKGTDEEVRFRRTGAVLKLLAGRAPNLDGLNPHVVLAEEVHAQNQDVIGVIKTAQGARLQPLWLGISTAGRNATGPAYDGWKSDQQVLEGKLRADRVFIAMYAADAEDEERRFDSIVVEKLNPLYGVSLNPTSLETEEREARKSEAKLQEYKRTRLNIWSRAAGNLFSTEKWDACADPKLTLDAFKGYPMFVGLDLASHSDLNAACFLICVEDVLYAVFMYWVPERSSRFSDDRYADQFAAWKRDGFLNTTKGSHVHHPTIRNDVLAMVRGHNVAGFAFDQHQADYLMGEVEAEGYTAYIVPKVARHITRATDDLVTRHIEPERFQHDGNPISSWCAGNVVAHRDANDNVLPKKEQRGSRQSIDGMDALITANAARLAAEAGMIEGGVKVAKPDVYLERGLMGFDA